MNHSWLDQRRASFETIALTTISRWVFSQCNQRPNLSLSGCERIAPAKKLSFRDGPGPDPEPMNTGASGICMARVHGFRVRGLRPRPGMTTFRSSFTNFLCQPKVAPGQAITLK